MNITVEKKELSDTVQRLEKVTGKQLNLEVLKCILITAKGKQIVLQATNLDIGIQTTLSAKVQKEGVVAVEATTLSAFLTNTEGSEVQLEVKKGGLFVSSGKTSATIHTIPEDDFPTFPAVSGEKISIPAEKIVKGLRGVWYAASSSSMKPELSSVYVRSVGKQIVCVATDSFRLAERKIQSENIEELPEMLIPLKNVGELIRNLEVATGNIELVGSDNQLSLVFGSTHITSRLIDGTFPDYEQIIPTEQTTEVVVLKQDFIGALKATHVFANRFNQATLVVDPKTKTLTLQTTGGDSGEATATLDAAITGEGIEANFNQKYITDCFQSIAEDSITLRFFGTGKPMVIRGVSDPSFIYLTMPMNR